RKAQARAVTEVGAGQLAAVEHDLRQFGSLPPRVVQITIAERCFQQVRGFENPVRPPAPLPLRAFQASPEELSAQQGAALELAVIQHTPRQVGVGAVHANEAQRQAVMINRGLSVLTAQQAAFYFVMRWSFAHACLLLSGAGSLSSPR